MSIVGVFTSNQTQAGGLYFDATLSEATQLSTTVTQFPVESGFTGTDHSVQEPLRITMRVGFTDNASRAARQTLPQGVDDVLDSLPDGVSRGFEQGFNQGFSAAYQAGRAQTRSQAALDQLRQLQRRGEPVNVSTLKKTYKNCLITDTRQETNKENENGMEIVVEFVELVTVGDVIGGPISLPTSDPAGTQGQETTELGLITPR